MFNEVTVRERCVCCASEMRLLKQPGDIVNIKVETQSGNIVEPMM